MTDAVEIVEVAPVLFAAVQAQTLRTDLFKTIRACLDKVYTFLKENRIRNDGINIVVYLDSALTIQAGVQVPERFEGNDTVMCLVTPAGSAVHTAHIGPYSEMDVAYSAIRHWGQETGIKTRGPSWEIYGHWTDDPRALRTDIYFLLQP